MKKVATVTVIVMIMVLSRFTDAAHVSNNISSANADRHAWNEIIGWIDFGAGEVEVTNTKLSGYASGLQIGPVALDCATTPNGNICGGPSGNWFVAKDIGGNLSGWAWSDAIGWISFSGSAPDYRVVIDPNTGIFSGWAWNDVIGWISFCGNTTGGSGTTGGCPLSPTHKVLTSLTPPPLLPGGGGGFSEGFSLVSSVFDTQVTQGAAFNWIMWRGELNGGRVGFQIASSNTSGGPWVYVGPDGLETGYYEMAADAQIKIPLTGPNNHNNRRYIRYKIYLDAAAGTNPRIDDVIISFSP